MCEYTRELIEIYKRTGLFEVITADVVWKEDARRASWIRVPTAVYVTSVLRMIGLNILAVLRSLSRRAWDSKPPPWEAIVQAVRFTLAVPTVVVSERFDCE